jgi:hypothetical protein
LLGPILSWLNRREEKRLAAGQVYEPPVCIERSNWGRPLRSAGKNV